MAVGDRACIFFHKNITCSPSLVLKTDFYFSVKTKSSVCYHFLKIHIIFAMRFVYIHARADTASLNQALHPNRSHWKRLSLRDQCNDSCYNVPRQMLWSWLRCWVQWHWYFTQFELFYFPNIIELVQRIIRFVMHTGPKASYRTVQYEYAYRYTPINLIFIQYSLS